MNKEDKLNNLNKLIGEYKTLAVAFSGGVDSTFLLAAAVKVLGKDRVTAITVIPPYVPGWEVLEAREFAVELGVEHVTLKEGIIDEVKYNPENRCYLCKKSLFSSMLNICRERNIEVLTDGSNVDDLGDYRPGMKALKELNILSPMLKTGITKQDIRDFSKEWELPTWEKPAYACLLTRIPHGREITTETLKRVEKSELELFNLGYRNIRVRDHGDVARIEMPVSEFESFVTGDRYKLAEQRLKALGYSYVTLDLGGYKMGNMNKTGV